MQVVAVNQWIGSGGVVRLAQPTKRVHSTVPADLFPVCRALLPSAATYDRPGGPSGGD